MRLACLVSASRDRELFYAFDSALRFTFKGETVSARRRNQHAGRARATRSTRSASRTRLGKIMENWPSFVPSRRAILLTASLIFAISTGTSAERRSEERRVGKEGRSPCVGSHCKEKDMVE